MRVTAIDTRGDGPSLFYVPGIDGSGQLLLGAAERFQEAFRLTRLAYDSGPARGYEELAAGVAARVREQTAEPVLLLAESFGVAVALRTAIDHPDLVAGLALVNGFAHFHDRLALAVTRGFFAIAPQAWIRAGRKRFAQRGLISPRRDEDALRGLLSLEGDWFGPGYRERLVLIRGLDLRTRLPEVRCPVHLYAADEDRVVDSVPAAREMAAGLPESRITVLKDAGHLVLPLTDEPWVERLRELARHAGLL
jgi:pimeloyl-ACP methyl ester carboxylesterase